MRLIQSQHRKKYVFYSVDTDKIVVDIRIEWIDTGNDPRLNTKKSKHALNRIDSNNDPRLNTKKVSISLKDAQNLSAPRSRVFEDRLSLSETLKPSSGKVP